MTRVQIVSPVRLYRDGIEQALSHRPFLSVVATSRDLNDAVRDAIRVLPDVLLLDVAMPALTTLIREVRQLQSPPKIVALALNDTAEEVIACIRAGISGYVSPEGSLDDLLAAIDGVMHEEMLCPPRITAALAKSLAGTAATAASTHLTFREREVMDLVDRGWSNKQIAQQLHITLATVKNHVHHVLRKVGVRSRREALDHVRDGHQPPKQHR